MDVPYDLTSYVRVLKMATTPTREEFFQVAKIAGAGILLVGLIGFLMGVVMLLLTGTGGM
ncbi:protein translocase SEC61 complex subunit gamma [Salinilacihabitans rarus]|uniref:protein translocase SEC61 complex subunit gamma n=1 Tax=Salinilacihabitans rarus TaxID=2961596 RepID=UPI0020C8AAFB|nr:protein translocase SEC61 complex subunit gamma [Salinilacihabitans rarus]